MVYELFSIYIYLFYSFEAKLKKDFFFLTGKNETYINNKSVVSPAQGVLKEINDNYNKSSDKMEKQQRDI